MRTAPGQGQQQGCPGLGESLLWPGQNVVFPWVGISSPNTILCVGRGIFWFCCSPDSRALWVAGIRASKGSDCFPSTHRENSLFCRSLPPIPCYVNPLDPHASAGHLTTESSDLLRCPSFKTPILDQRTPLGGPHSWMLSCSIPWHQPFSPISGGFPGVNLLARRYSAQWAAYVGPLFSCGAHRHRTPSQGRLHCKGLATDLQAQISPNSPDFSSCFIDYLQGSNPLVHWGAQVGVIKPF